MPLCLVTTKCYDKHHKGTHYVWCVHSSDCLPDRIVGHPPPPGAPEPARLTAQKSSIVDLPVATPTQDTKTMSCNAGCYPTCDCPQSPPSIQTPGGTSFPVQRAPGDGVATCWGIAGDSAVVAAAATVILLVTVANYAWLKPRKLVMMAADPAAATDVNNAAALVIVNTITAVGRQVIGSAVGVSAGAIDAYAQRGLTFGKSVPAITSANNIAVSVTNNHAAPLRISVAIEGGAQQ